METGPRVGSVLSRKRLKSATVPLGGNAVKTGPVTTATHCQGLRSPGGVKSPFHKLADFSSGKALHIGSVLPGERRVALSVAARGD